MQIIKLTCSNFKTEPFIPLVPWVMLNGNGYYRLIYGMILI